ncbi:MAG: hypothetical protein AAF567_14460 [Actinomycetota bacterium]
MATRTEYELTAELFADTAARVSSVSVSVTSLDVERSLRGGQLAIEVGEASARATREVDAAIVSIDDVERECRRRAELIAAYEAELAAYHLLHAAWLADLADHRIALQQAVEASAGEPAADGEPDPLWDWVAGVAPPPLRPAPTPPTPLPSWAEIRSP